jgi:hypothetical protein
VGDASGRLQTLGRLVIDGGGGQNQLSVRDFGTTAAATYAITPTFISRPLGGADAIQYSNVENLVVSGGSGGNQFLIDGGLTAKTTIATGAGNGNTVQVGTQQQVADGMDLTVTGNGSNDQVFFNDQLSPAAHSYSVTGSALVRDGGRVVVRTGGVEGLTLRAGTGGNTTTLAGLGAMATTVQAGIGGRDAITVFGFQTAPVTVSDASGTATLRVNDGFLQTPQTYTVTATALSRSGAASVSYSGLASLELDASNAADLVNANSTSVATKVTAGANSTIHFGTGPFAGPLSVQVFGGGGTLDYTGYAQGVYANLQTGEATDVASLSGIRTVNGGNGNDILVGDGQGDVLNGGFGRNLLIAGGAAGALPATLNGGSDEDILIGGRTAYDLDRAALNAIMAAWSGNGFYADRVRQLATGANGAPCWTRRRSSATRRPTS